MRNRHRVTLSADLLNLDRLTTKQREAVHLVVQGMTTTDIASKLGATEKAIYTRIASASRRLQVNDRRELIRAVCPALYAPKSPPPVREPSISLTEP